MAKKIHDTASEEKKRLRKEKAAKADYVVGYAKPADHCKFQPGNQAARKKPKPPANYGWAAWEGAYPENRPKSLFVTDLADLGADMLEELVPYPINGKIRKVPFAFVAIHRSRKDIIAGSRRDYTESMRLLRSIGAVDRVRERQERRARQAERKATEWWQRRSWALKMLISKALEEGRVNPDLALDDIINMHIFEGEEDRLYAELDINFDDASDPVKADKRDTYNPSEQSIADDDSQFAAGDCAGGEGLDPEVANRCSVSIDAEGNYTANPHDPLDLACGHLGEKDGIVGQSELQENEDQSEPLTEHGDDVPPDDFQPTPASLDPSESGNGATAKSGANGEGGSSTVGEPPGSHIVKGKPSAANLKPGERLCWIEKGPGDQEIRNKGGWKHGAKPER